VHDDAAGMRLRDRFSGQPLGPSCDHLVDAEVVTADGRLLAADQDGPAELLWALRGGGGNFGVVTQLELCLHLLGPTVLAGQLLYPRARAAELLGLVGDLMATAPDALGLGVALTCTPDLPFVPQAVRGRPVAGVTVCWAGELATGERLLGPLRAFGPPAADTIRPMPYVDAQRLLDPLVPPGRRYHSTGEYLRALPDQAIEVLLATPPVPRRRPARSWCSPRAERSPDRREWPPRSTPASGRRRSTSRSWPPGTTRARSNGHSGRGLP
jgi:hypothetical protein